MNTEGVLPSNISLVVRNHTIALALAHSLWAPPHALCLRAAARRLVELMDLLPLEFAALEKKGIPKRGQIIEWVYWLESVLRGISSPSKADLDIAISPIDALNRATGTKVRHPLSGYGMTEFPVYSLLLITPPSDDVGRAGFDKIAAYAAWFGISEHLSYSSDEYLHFVDTFHSYKSGNLSGSEWQDVAPFVLSKQGRLDNARRAVAALQQSASLSPLIAQAGNAESVSDVVYVISEIIQSLNHENSDGHRRLAGQINGLITLLNDKPPREYSTETKSSPESISAQNVSEDQSSSKRSSKSENIGTLEKREGTYYQLETLFLEPEAPDESDASIPLIYENESDPEDWDENGEEDDKTEQSKQEISRVEREEQLEPSTLQVWSLNKLEFTRRLAEYQPFGLDYVCIDSRLELIESLTEIVNKNDDKQASLAASYILATIVTGRRLQSLLGGVIAHDCPEPRTDNQLLIVEPTSRTLQLRLNKPELRLAPAKSSLKVGEWITVPDHLGISLSLRPLSLSEQTLLSAAQHYLRLADNMPQFVVDYAQQYIQSDSAEETCFARLLGVSPNPAAIAHEQALRKQTSASSPVTINYQFSGAIRDISTACTKEKNKEVARTSAITVARESLTREGLTSTENLIIEWSIWMLDVRKLAPSTCAGHMVTLYRPLQASLLQLDMPFIEQNSDQWDALVDDMTRDIMRRNNLFDAVVEMTRFLNFKTDGGFKHSGYSEPALVNAYVISNVEKNEALKLLEIKYGGNDPELAKQGQFAIELAHHLGNRRWEYLGLTFRDVMGKKDPILKIRNNSIRWVKTDTSNRVIPLKLLWRSPLYKSWRMQTEAPEHIDPWESILETIGFSVAKNERRMFDAINDVLCQVTGSPEVTYHTLRHTAICRMLLALYWDELKLEELCEFDYFREIAEASRSIRNILLRHHTYHFSEHKTVSAIVGHLSFSTTAGHYFHFMDLMRWGILRQINEKSLVPDNPAWLIALTKCSSTNANSCSEVLDNLEQQHPERFLRHTEALAKRLDFSGLGLREKLRVVGETIAKTPDERNIHLSKLISDDEKRSRYLSGLNNRLELIQDLLEKRKQWSTKHGAILVMPTDRTVQIEILSLINRVASKYKTNGELQALSIDLLKALEHLKVSQPGCFTFKSPEEARQVLEPVTALLDMTKTEIDCWYYYTKRVGKTQLKQKEKEMRINSLSSLPDNFRGELIVRFAFGDLAKNSPQRTLLWAMSSIFCAYGK